MNKKECFKSGRLLYRGIDESDTEYIVKWRSDTGLIRFFVNNEPVTLQSHIDWYCNYYLRNNQRFDFIIIEKTSGQKIGTVGASRIDFQKGSCEISYMIAELDYRHKGYASEAVIAIMKRMREEKVHCFYAEIHKDNADSIGLVKRLGWLLDKHSGDFMTFTISEG